MSNRNNKFCGALAVIFMIHCYVFLLPPRTLQCWRRYLRGRNVEPCNLGTLSIRWYLVTRVISEEKNDWLRSCFAKLAFVSSLSLSLSLDRVSRFFALDCNPPTYTCCVVGITVVYHQSLTLIFGRSNKKGSFREKYQAEKGKIRLVYAYKLFKAYRKQPFGVLSISIRINTVEA
jgi:hypothetical protein